MYVSICNVFGDSVTDSGGTVKANSFTFAVNVQLRPLGVKFFVQLISCPPCTYVK